MSRLRCDPVEMICGRSTIFICLPCTHPRGKRPMEGPGPKPPGSADTCVPGSGVMSPADGAFSPSDTQVMSACVTGEPHLGDLMC
jgi:hypothetical protein